jgi:hypothetical protein
MVLARVEEVGSGGSAAAGGARTTALGHVRVRGLWGSPGKEGTHAQGGALLASALWARGGESEPDSAEGRV